MNTSSTHSGTRTTSNRSRELSSPGGGHSTAANSLATSVGPGHSRILMVDDDRELCELVREYLKPDGLHVELEHDGEVGLFRAQSGAFELVILDVMLPTRNGLEVLSQLRGVSPVPVIMLTARGDEDDRIKGLELGADDYLPKP